MAHRAMRAGALVVAMGAVGAACVGAQTDDGAGGASDLAQPAEAADQADTTLEPIGETSQDWTKADCYAMWKHNLQLCNSAPPNLRPECFAACAVMLAGCLAASQG